MAGIGALPSDWRQRYDATMADAESRYRDVLEALNDAGVAAEMTQTGGMCLAITWPAGDGRHYLLTDQEGPLSWDRDPGNGWALGLYSDEECGEAIGDVLERNDQTVAQALALLAEARGGA